MKHSHIEGLVLATVLLVGLAGVAFIYQINTGKAWMTSPTILVRQTQPEICCCKTSIGGHYFQVFGKVLKDAQQTERQANCKKICEVEHGSSKHPTELVQVGKCGGGR